MDPARLLRASHTSAFRGEEGGEAAVIETVSGTLTNLVAEMGEIALAARCSAEFRVAALACLVRQVGAEGGAICGFLPGLQPAYDGHHLVSGVTLDNRRACAYLSEFSESEKLRGLRGPAWQDRDVIGAPRRERLSLYRDYLHKLDVRTFAARGWADGAGVHLAVLTPAGAVDVTRFMKRAQPALDAVFPILALAERLFVPASSSPTERSLQAWADGHGVTPSEFRVIALVERGLTNPEIAAVLSVSPNTVRNRLATAFRKLDVSRRAELVYHLGVARELVDVR